MAKMIGLARLGRDAEVRHLQDGTAVANLALAFNYGKKVDGKQPTQWVDAALFGKRAESLAQYLTKGTAIVATLSDVHIETFEKKDGVQGFALRARMDDMEFAGGAQQSERAPQPAPQGGGSNGGPNFADDQIPFAPLPSHIY